MSRDRKAGILLMLAAVAFAIFALLSEPRRPFSFVAAGALALAGVVRFWRSRGPTIR
jgi:hypothetical protein